MQVTNLVDKTEVYSLEVYLEIAKVDGLIILSFQPKSFSVSMSESPAWNTGEVPTRSPLPLGPRWHLL